MYTLLNVKITNINGGVTAEVTYGDGVNPDQIETINYQSPEMPCHDAELLTQWVKDRAIAHVEGKNIEHSQLPSQVTALIGQDIPLN